MVLGKRIDLIYYEKKTIPFRVGYSIGTVYMIDPEDYNRFKLYNVGYCPSTQDFYYNRMIRLPKKLIEHFESRRYRGEILEKEMEEIGICKSSDVAKLFEDYQSAQIQKEIAKEKVLNLKRNLKPKK